MSVARIGAALLLGTVFGFGLSLAGVLDPTVVRSFLDFFGPFDPRLAFVFVSALFVCAVGYLLSRRLRQPAFGRAFAVSARKKVDQPLVAGSALFGIGWGMVGLCPGPAIAALALGLPSVFVFTVSMLVGMGAFELWRGRRIAGEAIA